jgi:hypothetical protein
MTTLQEIETRLASDRDDFADGYSDQSIRDRAALVAMVRERQAAIDDLLYIAEHKADRSKPVGQRWSEVIKGTIERRMGATK